MAAAMGGTVACGGPAALVGVACSLRGCGSCAQTIAGVAHARRQLAGRMMHAARARHERAAHATPAACPPWSRIPSITRRIPGPCRAPGPSCVKPLTSSASQGENGDRQPNARPLWPHPRRQARRGRGTAPRSAAGEAWVHPAAAAPRRRTRSTPSRTAPSPWQVEPGCRAALSLLGHCQYQREEYEGAAQAYEALVARCPAVPAYRLHWAQSLAKAGRYAEAAGVAASVEGFPQASWRGRGVEGGSRPDQHPPHPCSPHAAPTPRRCASCSAPSSTKRGTCGAAEPRSTR